jgi:hypothetical protein
MQQLNRICTARGLAAVTTVRRNVSYWCHSERLCTGYIVILLYTAELGDQGEAHTEGLGGTTVVSTSDSAVPFRDCLLKDTFQLNRRTATNKSK